MKLGQYLLLDDKRQDICLRDIYILDSALTLVLLNELIDIECTFSLIFCHFSRHRPRASGNRLEDNTLNASPLPVRTFETSETSDGELILRFRGIFPEQSRSKVSSDSTDVGRTCCLSRLSLSPVALPVLSFSQSSCSPPCSHVEVNRETGVSHTSRFFVRFRYSRVGAVKR